MALEVAAERNVSPWDALLLSVRLAAGRVAWVDAQLSAAQDRVQAADGDGGVAAAHVARWLVESRRERTLLARVSKAAVDAGVAERLVRQQELETAIIVRVLGRTLDALGLDADKRLVAYEVVHQELTAIDSAQDLVEGGGGS